MSYTFDLARRKSNGFGQSIILKAIEYGRINGTNNLSIGRSSTEPDQTYLLPVQSADKDGVQEPAAPDAPLLSRDRGPRNRGRDEPAPARCRSRGYRGRRSAAGRRQGRRPGSTQSRKFESKVNEPCLERRAWDPDIRISDPERAAKAVSSSSAQSTYAVMGVLLGASAMGWMVGAPPSLFDGRHSIPIEQKVGSSGQIPGSKNQTTFAGPETGRVTTPGASNTGKVAAPTPGAHGHRPGYTKSAAQRPDAIRTSSVAQPSTGPSEPAVSDVGHRSRIASSPMPFPETRPETIEGWTVRDVSGATAILDGPDGTWRAARGEVVPRVGRVESIVRWGSRWIVVTSSGLISTP